MKKFRILNLFIKNKNFEFFCKKNEMDITDGKNYR